jgi:hypothetical protein
LRRIVLSAGRALVVAACASSPDGRSGPPATETLHVVNDANRLIAVNGGRPGVALSDRALSGLQPGGRILGIDWRVARGQLALGSSGSCTASTPPPRRPRRSAR